MKTWLFGAVLVPTVLAAVPFGTAAQGAEAAGSGTRYFGAPVLKVTTIRDQGAVMLGGRGGWNVSPSLMLGFGVYGTLTEVDAAPGAVPEVSYALDVKLETFGFDMEYAVSPAAPTHITLTAFVGGAANHYYKDGTNEQEGETDFMLVLEPSVGVERRVARWLHLNLAGSYRLLGGVEQSGLQAGDLQGPSVVLAAKIGRF